MRKPSAPTAGSHLLHAEVISSRSRQASLIAAVHRALSESSRALWLKPTLAVAVGLVLGTALGQANVPYARWMEFIAFRGNANDARQVLTVIIGALIPVTSLVFALTVVTLQIASTQFSPRLLRTFMRDNGTQFVLSSFIGTVAYCLAVLYEVNTDAASDSVPRIAITIALTLAVGCICALVYYLGHITNSVRIDTIMRQVEWDTRRVLHSLHPVADLGEDPDAEDLAPSTPTSVKVLAHAEGYLQGIDPRLVGVAQRKDLTIRVVPTVGYFVLRGQVLAEVSVNGDQPFRKSTADAVRQLIDIAPERRVERDFGLGLRQLIDITNRAMSTGQNDPYTGTQSVHHLTSLLVDSANRSFRTREWRDGAGAQRVVLPVMTFPTHLKVVCGHVRQGGLERHPRVVHEVLRMLGAVAESAPFLTRVLAARREVEVLLEAAPRIIQSAADLADVEADATRLLRSIDRRIIELQGSTHPQGD